MYLVSYHHLRSGIEHLPMYLVSYHQLRSVIEISVSTEARETSCFLDGPVEFNGKSPDYKEMDVRVCLCFAVISFTS